MWVLDSGHLCLFFICDQAALLNGSVRPSVRPSVTLSHRNICSSMRLTFIKLTLRYFYDNPDDQFAFGPKCANIGGIGPNWLKMLVLAFQSERTIVKSLNLKDWVSR